MANSLGKTLDMMFESFIEAYEPSCVISREATSSYPSPKDMQRAGDTFYRRQAFNASVVTGLDVSAAAKTDVIDRFVPTTYRSPDNVVFQLDAKEMRDPLYMQKQGEAASLRLAAEIDKNIYATIAAEGSIVVKKVGALTWDDGAQAEALMLSRGITGTGRGRKLFLNPFDYKDVAKDLGNRAYMGTTNLDAYEKSRVPDIAGFQTFRTENSATLAAIGTVAATTVTANTSHTPTGMTGSVPTDNRVGTLGVSGANIANIKNGDSFTIAGVNVANNVDKTDTGQLQTFRVISGGGTATLTISPQIVITGPYQNATAQAAAGAALVFLNTVSKPVNAFFAEGSLALDYGYLVFPEGAGVDVRRATTKNGVPLLMATVMNGLTGIAVVRFTTLYATTLLDREQAGIIVANQT